VDFTREPIIESVITPKEGCKLVVRSSKGAGQEEFFVDAVEIVSFGGTFFLRSLEKPKSFLVPATDYEILEVRETRMVLKNVGLDRSIKIGGGREAATKRPAKEASKPEIPEPRTEPKVEPKRRERRRQYRRRRGKDAALAPEQQDVVIEEEEEKTRKRVRIAPPEAVVNLEEEGIGKPIKPTSSILNTLLPPPTTLISESIERYKGNELFKNVFIPKEEREKLAKDQEWEGEEHEGHLQPAFEEVENPSDEIEEDEFTIAVELEDTIPDFSREECSKEENFVERAGQEENQNF
jgi:hypothetical protein